MNKVQLNSAAIAAQSGDQEAMWRIKQHFHRFITNLSDANRNRIASQESFESQCFNLIEDKVLRYCPGKDNLEWIIRVSFYKRLKRSKDRFTAKTKGVELSALPYLTYDDGHEEELLKDDLAIVDSDYLLNERVTDLAAGDSLRLVILNSWIESTYNDSETARMLAHQYGGNTESYRKKIQRFKTECQKALACTG